MISLKLAFRSVFRRPQQNIAVVLGIALGVSLFVGVQVGGDSLNAGLTEVSLHPLGERDATISPTATSFFLTPGIIAEETNPMAPNATSIVTGLQNNDSLDDEVKAFAERLHLTMTILQPESGSIEIGKRLAGIPTDQDQSFGQLFNREGDTIELGNLEKGEVYIGEEAADGIFGEEDPLGKTITAQTTLFSFAQPQLNISSIPVSLSANFTIADVFVDEGLGREQFSNFIATPLIHLQDLVVDAFNQAKVHAFQQDQAVIGYGHAPISNIYIIWEDSIKPGDGSAEATQQVEYALNKIVSNQFSNFFSVTDTRANTQEQINSATDTLELLLNGFGAIIILAGVLVIVNIQSMALAARERETGILRAIGAKRGQIIRANLLESLFLGVFGSGAGLGGGILYGRLLVAFLGIAFEFDTGDIPTVVTQDTLVYSFLAGFILSQITGLVPAINASRINIARVLRGIDAPEKEEFGKKSLYLGVLTAIAAVIGISTLDPNPFIDGTDAFRQIDDVQRIYLPMVLLVVGPALLITYFKNFRLGLTVIGVFLLGWAYFNIFYVMDFIEGGSGTGIWYILYLIGSLLIGTIIIMAVNLGNIAAAGQKLTSWLARSSETPIRGTAMVAFRKMRSKVTRSTLTFALFATILTLNIWIGTFSYTFRYGVDSQVLALTGGSDMVMYSPDNALPESLDFSQKLLDEFGEASQRGTYLTNVKPFAVTGGNPYYRDSTDPTSQRTLRAVSVAPDAFWENTDQENWIFPFDLADNKTGTPFEEYKDQESDPAATFEDENVWKAIANNGTIPNKDGEMRPVIASSLIFEFSGTNFEIIKRQGDSIFLNMTDGTIQEFVIGGVLNGAPLADFSLSGGGQGPGGGGEGGPPGLTPTVFFSDFWKDKLQAFSGYGNSENTFLGKANVDDPNDPELPPLFQNIERWANAGEFQEENGLYGLIAITTYSIYEAQLEGQYRFFQFLQAFVSLGFAVGILGLLVVASRSVAERTREIGMLRALGFRRRDVVISVVLELIVMGMIGLFIGFINGTVMGYALTQVQSGTQFLIPWGLVVIYGVATLLSAILAAILPAIRASQIPASDALRYTG